MAEMTDAILAAGFRWCPACRAEAYPGDAAWLAADLILASYPPLCRHDAQAIVQLVTPSALVPAPDLCAGTTTAGTRCRRRPPGGAAYCYLHIPRKLTPAQQIDLHLQNGPVHRSRSADRAMPGPGCARVAVLRTAHPRPRPPGQRLMAGDDHGAKVNTWLGVVRRARCNATTKLIALLLASYADADGSRIYPGAARLAVQSGHSYRTVQRELAQLRAMGLIEAMPRAGQRRGWKSGYRLILAADLLDRCDVPTPATEDAAVGAVQSRERDRVRKHRGKHRRDDETTRHLDGAPVDNLSMDGTTTRHPDGVTSDDVTPSLRATCNANPNSLTSDDDTMILPVPPPGSNPPCAEADHRDPGTGIARVPAADESDSDSQPDTTTRQGTEQARMIADSALDEWQRENPDPVIASTIRMRREFTITARRLPDDRTQRPQRRTGQLR